MASNWSRDEAQSKMHIERFKLFQGSSIVLVHIPALMKQRQHRFVVQGCSPKSCVENLSVDRTIAGRLLSELLFYLRKGLLKGVLDGGSDCQNCSGPQMFELVQISLRLTEVRMHLQELDGPIQLVQGRREVLVRSSIGLVQHSGHVGDSLVIVQLRREGIRSGDELFLIVDHLFALFVQGRRFPDNFLALLVEQGQVVQQSIERLARFRTQVLHLVDPAPLRPGQITLCSSFSGFQVVPMPVESIICILLAHACLDNQVGRGRRCQTPSSTQTAAAQRLRQFVQ
mmetsp:Transcript_20958/g.45299  ORF Transcript_20958/g.45299 Transcript_20958/m.45299 type:complete len:285 (+) Transcript_20958:1902-2756(+)